MDYTDPNNGWPLSDAERRALVHIVDMLAAEDAARASEAQLMETEARRAAGEIFLPTLVAASTQVSISPPAICVQSRWIESHQAQPGRAAQSGAWRLTREGRAVAGHVRNFAADKSARRQKAVDAIVFWAHASGGHRVDSRVFRAQSSAAWYWTHRFDNDEINNAILWARYLGLIVAEEVNPGRRKPNYWDINVTTAGARYVAERVGSIIPSADLPRAGTENTGQWGTGSTQVVVNGNATVFVNSNVAVNWNQVDPVIAELLRELIELNKRSNDEYRYETDGLRAAASYERPGILEGFLREIVKRVSASGADEVAQHVIGLANQAIRLLSGGRWG